MITQNIDMLHRKAGTRALVEVHGSIESCSCPSCGESVSREQARARLLEDARRRSALRALRASRLKPDVVLFGEMLADEPLGRARELCERADVLLCIGSSLEVHPVAGLPRLTHDRGGAVAILTRGPTPLDGLASVRLSGDVVEDMQALLGSLGVASAAAFKRGRASLAGP